MNEPINTLGFKEMHPMQVEALIDLVNQDFEESQDAQSASA